MGWSVPDVLAPAVVAGGGGGPSPDRAGYRVFIDFDNTITCGDVLDRLIETLAVGHGWRELEEAWAAGQIGALACLDGQLRAVRAGWPELGAVLDAVQLDPGFVTLRDLLRAEGIELTILSDNFDAFIAYVLRRHGLADVPFFANRVEVAGGRTLPSFPFANPDCPGCAHCKKTHFVPRGDDRRRVIYIGDGRSDLCPARHADLVFAKASLLTSLRAEQIDCVAFGDLADVARALRHLFHESKI
jgi:2-hydroxy-3-keto-5-methylthiopentenyl-1-phosphate phosphatase